MSEDHRSRNERIGISRWIVPHPSFGWYVRGVGLGALFTSGFFGLAAWHSNRRLVASLADLEGFADPRVLEALAGYASSTMWMTAIAAVGAPLFVVVFSLYFLHKISGPIYRIHGHMQRLIAGAPASELVLRKDDQLQDVCRTYNQLLDQLELFEPKPDESPPAR